MAHMILGFGFVSSRTFNYQSPDNCFVSEGNLADNLVASADLVFRSCRQSPGPE